MALRLTWLEPGAWLTLSVLACVWPGDDYFLLLIGGMPATFLFGDHLVVEWAVTITVLAVAGWLGDRLRAAVATWGASFGAACALLLGLLAALPAGREFEPREVGSWLALGRIGCCAAAVMTIALALAITYFRVLSSDLRDDGGLR